MAEWWTAPAEADNGLMIMVTGRKDIGKFRGNPRFKYRVEVSMPYKADSTGMPDAATTEIIGEATEALEAVFEADPVAVLTGIFTGDSRRDWIFYTLSLNIFGRKLNEALAPLPTLPLEISAYEDPGWEAYDEMAAAEVS